MRIVYYTWPSYIDHALPQVLALSRQHEVHLLIETAPESKGGGALGPLPDNLPAGVHQDAWPSLCGWLPAALEAELSQVIRVHRIVHDGPRAYLPPALRVSAAAARFVRSLRPDVMHFDETQTRAAWIFPLLGRLPIVVNVHDLETHPGDTSSRITTIRRLAWRRVSHLIFHSKYSQERYVLRHDLPRRPAAVVPFGPLDIFRSWAPATTLTEPHTVLFFGRLSAYKGLDTLLAAAPQIAAAVPDARFIIAGAPVRDFTFPPLPTLPEGAAYEVLPHFITNADLCTLFERATVVVVPYESATQSGVVMTAFGFGKPVVATAVGGLAEAVEDDVTGLLVPPRDPMALAAATVALLRDPDRRARMSAAIDEQMRDEYSWAAHAAGFTAVYRAAIARQGGEKQCAS